MAQQSVDLAPPAPLLLLQAICLLSLHHLEPQNHIPFQAMTDLPECLASLPFYRVPQARGMRQPLGYDEAQPGARRFCFFSQVEIEALTPHHTFPGHCRGKLTRQVQAAIRPEPGLARFRRRDDDGPWHDAHESPRDHRGCACVQGNRGYACGERPMADKCVS